MSLASQKQIFYYYIGPQLLLEAMWIAFTAYLLKAIHCLHQLINVSCMAVKLKPLASLNVPYVDTKFLILVPRISPNNQRQNGIWQFIDEI